MQARLVWILFCVLAVLGLVDIAVLNLKVLPLCLSEGSGWSTPLVVTTSPLVVMVVTTSPLAAMSGDLLAPPMELLSRPSAACADGSPSQETPASG